MTNLSQLQITIIKQEKRIIKLEKNIRKVYSILTDKQREQVGKLTTGGRWA